jgi:hypothetical protein
VPWPSCMHGPPTSTGTSTTTPVSNERYDAASRPPRDQAGRTVRGPSALAVMSSADGVGHQCFRSTSKAVSCLRSWAAHTAKRDRRATVIRADVWTTNRDLHAYYERQHFTRREGGDP